MEDCVMTIADLGKLPFEAVVPLSKRMACGSPADWADKLGVSPNILNRAFSSWQDDREYFVTFSKVPELCVHMRSTVLIQWALARYEYLSRELALPAEPIDLQDCLSACARLMREVGEAAGEIEAASADGKMSKVEMRRIRREVADVVKVCFDILNGLSSALEAGDNDK